MIPTSRRHRVIVAVCAVAVAGTAVVAVAATAPKSGKWTGTTSEAGNAVSFTVSSNHKSITKFTTHVGYNGACGQGGAGNWPVSIAKLTITKKHAFSGSTIAHIGIYRETMVVSGKFSGTKATGTVGNPSKVCPAGSLHPRRKYTWETFTATHA